MSQPAVGGRTAWLGRLGAEVGRLLRLAATAATRTRPVRSLPHQLAPGVSGGSYAATCDLGA